MSPPPTNSNPYGIVKQKSCIFFGGKSDSRNRTELRLASFSDQIKICNFRPDNGLSERPDPIHYPVLFRPFQSFTPTETPSSSLMLPGKSKRPICPSCSKPTQTCLYSRILTSGIDNSVSVTIQQHSLESKHPLNSTRIARLGLRNLNVVTVSDVNFEARFVIWLMKPDSESGLVRNGSDSLASHQASESVDEHACSSDFKKESEPRRLPFLDNVGKCNLKNDIGTMKSSLVCTVGVNHVVDSKLSVNDCVEMHDNAEIDENTGDSDFAITVVIGKHGVINSYSHIWRSLTQPQKPSFMNILSCPEACEALSKGFMVKKLQRSKLGGSNINLQDEEEEYHFELEVPSRSDLDEKAVDITDLDAIDFEIKNLIV